MNGKFEDITDYQTVVFASLLNFDYIEIPDNLKENNKYINKTFKELYDNNSLPKSKKFLKQMIDNGFGDYLIVEIVSDDKTGFDSVVLKDTDGNYVIDYLCTNADEVHDILFDAYPFFKNVLPKSREYTFYKQQQQAINIAEYYYKIAELEGKKINIAGYSLGGNLAENAYLALNFNHKNTKTLNKLNLFNPYHDNLDEIKINVLNNSDKVNIICSEGDPVSAIFNNNDLNNVTKYIYIDYENVMKQGQNLFDALIFKLHSIEAVTAKKEISFNEDGSVKDEIKINGNEIYKPHSISNIQIIRQWINRNKQTKNQEDIDNDIDT